MRILLTGAGGFIGSAFARAAVAKGHSIAGLLIPSERVPAGLEENPQVCWVRGTLSDAPWKEIEAFRPEVCVHTAWVTSPGVYLESPANLSFLKDSKLFLSRACDAGVSHIVGLGTCIEYQITGAPLAEDTTPLVPTTTYAKCKNELRIELEKSARSEAFQLCWARVFYPYGPGEHPSRLCSSIIQKLCRGESVVLKTPDSTKDYIFIEDLAAALVTLVERKYCGAINLGTGTGISVRQIASTIGSLLGKPELIQETPNPEQDPFGCIVADATRLRGLGWQPQFEFIRGLQQLIESVR